MKEGKVTILYLLLAIFSFSLSFGQNEVYSTIAKNINSEANSLQHNLNSTGDTLLLSSVYNLYKVEFIGANNSKVFEIERGKKETSIPLASVPVGEYTIAIFQIEKIDTVFQYQKTIIFRVSRLLPIKPMGIEKQYMLATNSKLEPKTIESENTVGLVEKDAFLIHGKTNSSAMLSAQGVEAKKVYTQTKPEQLIENKNRVASLSYKPNKEFSRSKKTTTQEKELGIRSKNSNDFNSNRKPNIRTENLKTYNLTDGGKSRLAVQSRAEYRANNLRPNGKPYN